LFVIVVGRQTPIFRCIAAKRAFGTGGGLEIKAGR